jgi:hypothetical protein
VYNGCMPSQFPISNPYPFEKDKGDGLGSFYYGHIHKSSTTPLQSNVSLKVHIESTFNP